MEALRRAKVSCPSRELLVPPKHRPPLHRAQSPFTSFVFSELSLDSNRGGGTRTLVAGLLEAAAAAERSTRRPPPTAATPCSPARVASVASPASTATPPPRRTPGDPPALRSPEPDVGAFLPTQPTPDAPSTLNRKPGSPTAGFVGTRRLSRNSPPHTVRGASRIEEISIAMTQGHSSPQAQPSVSISRTGGTHLQRVPVQPRGVFLSSHTHRGALLLASHRLECSTFLGAEPSGVADHLSRAATVQAPSLCRGWRCPAAAPPRRTRRVRHARVCRRRRCRRAPRSARRRRRHSAAATTTQSASGSRRRRPQKWWRRGR